MYRTKVFGNRRHTSVSDVHDPFNGLRCSRSAQYHYNISALEVKKLTDLQYYVYQRGQKISKPLGRAPPDTFQSTDSLDRSSSVQYKRGPRSPRVKRGRAVLTKSFSGPTPSVSTLNETPPARESIPEMISIIHDLFAIASQMPGFMKNLLNEDFGFDNLNVEELKAVKRKKSRPVKRPKKSTYASRVNKLIKSGTV